MTRDQWITSRAAAEILGLHPRSLQRMDDQLHAQGVRTQRTLGGHRRYYADDLRALTERLTTPATQGPSDPTRTRVRDHGKFGPGVRR
jgi:hypothetical protein